MTSNTKQNRIETEAENVFQAQHINNNNNLNGNRNNANQPDADDSDTPHSQFTIHQLVIFIFVVVIGVASMLLWKYRILGDTDFPWFVHVIGAFLFFWALHFWLSRASKDIPEEKKKRIYFWLHMSLFVILNGVLSLTWFAIDSTAGPWFIYPLAATSVGLGIHFTCVFTPQQWRWFVGQLFVYLIVVAAGCVLWDVEPWTGYWWVYIALIYGAILVLQVTISFLVTHVHARILKSVQKKVLARNPKKTYLLEAPPFSKLNSRGKGAAPNNGEMASRVHDGSCHVSEDSYDAGASSDESVTIVIEPDEFWEPNAMHSSATSSSRDVDSEENITDTRTPIIGTPGGNFGIPWPRARDYGTMHPCEVGSPVYQIEVLDGIELQAEELRPVVTRSVKRGVPHGSAIT